MTLEELQAEHLKLRAEFEAFKQRAEPVVESHAPDNAQARTPPDPLGPDFPPPQEKQT